MSSLIVLAPSGSGKSHFVVFGRDPERRRIVDGDSIITLMAGWPDGKWWERPDADQIHLENFQIIELYRHDNPDTVVLFNGHMPHRPSGAVAMVIVPEDAHRRNLDHRLMTKARGKDTHQPTDWAGTLRARAHYYSLAARWDIPIFSSFEEALRGDSVSNQGYDPFQLLARKLGY